VRAVQLRVLWIEVIGAAARVPFTALVAMRGNAAGAPQHVREGQQIPGHEARAAPGEFVLRSAGTWIEVRRSGPGFANPSTVGLRRNQVPQVLQRVEYTHGTVFGAVFVAGDDAAADAAVVDKLTVSVQLAGCRIEPFHDLGADRGFVGRV
jgi:hypothetical protein